MECVFILGTLGCSRSLMIQHHLLQHLQHKTDNLLTQQTKLVGPSHPLPQSWGQQNADEVSKLPA